MLFYTYKWSDSGKPFYVGKGKGNRFLPRDDRPGHLGYKIAKMNRTGHPIVITIIPHATEEEALQYEIVSINTFGRQDKGTGPLLNLTDGGDNPPSQKGMKRSVETRRRISKGRKALNSIDRTPEWRANIGKALKGNTGLIESGRKMGLAGKGRKQTPEQIAKKVAAYKETVRRKREARHEESKNP